MSGLGPPEETLAYRPIKNILASKADAIWSISSTDSVLRAVQIMAERDIGLVVVLDSGALVGVLSERDCVRKLLIDGKDAAATPVSDIAVRDIATVDPSWTYAECLGLLHERRIRHLIVVEHDNVVGVISIRDLLAEAVKRHEQLIVELERERWTMVTSVV